MKIYIINGPNLNMLGIREPNLYGHTDYRELTEQLTRYAEEKQIELILCQSNHEGCLVDKIQEAYFEKCDGIVLNPGAYTHTSIALLDALKAVGIPTVEVHISDISRREDFRKVSYVRPACVASVIGHGTQGYFEAIDILMERCC